MVNIVIKKDGKEEPFNEEKIRNAIKAACLDAGLDENKQNELSEIITQKILGTLADKETIRAIELRDKILGELDIMSPEAAQAWRNYEDSKSK
ncbi:MAG: ATP cone domain-containing protein [Candidatus Paceibacterota bacterium]